MSQSHCQRVLEALQDANGAWVTSEQLYRRLGGMVLHSRIAELRKRGHTIEGRHVPGETGAAGYEYRLLLQERLDFRLGETR